MNKEIRAFGKIGLSFRMQNREHTKEEKRDRKKGRGTEGKCHPRVNVRWAVKLAKWYKCIYLTPKALEKTCPAADEAMIMMGSNYLNV